MENSKVIYQIEVRKNKFYKLTHSFFNKSNVNDIQQVLEEVIFYYGPEEKIIIHLQLISEHLHVK